LYFFFQNERLVLFPGPCAGCTFFLQWYCPFFSFSPVREDGTLFFLTGGKLFSFFAGGNVIPFRWHLTSIPLLPRSAQAALPPALFCSRRWISLFLIALPTCTFPSPQRRPLPPAELFFFFKPPFPAGKPPTPTPIFTFSPPHGGPCSFCSGRSNPGTDGPARKSLFPLLLLSAFFF